MNIHMIDQKNRFKLAIKESPAGSLLSMFTLAAIISGLIFILPVIEEILIN